MLVIRTRRKRELGWVGVSGNLTKVCLWLLILVGGRPEPIIFGTMVKRFVLELLNSFGQCTAWCLTYGRDLAEIAKAHLEGRNALVGPCAGKICE